MADIVDVTTRSRMMSGIRGTNTNPERVVRKLLHSLGFRFRIHVRSLPGKPDIVLPKFKAVVLIHGCFWHGHDCPLFRVPATRPEFWANKIRRNRENDVLIADRLLTGGWRVVTVWECAIRGRTGIGVDRLAELLTTFIRGRTKILTIRGLSGAKA